MALRTSPSFRTWLSFKMKQRPASMFPHLRKKSPNPSPALANHESPMPKQCDAMSVFAGVAAIGALAGIGKFWWENGKSMTKEQVLLVFDDLGIAIQQVFDELCKAEAETMKQAKVNDEHIDINHLRQALRQKFIEAIAQTEVELIERTSFTKEDFQSALIEMQLDHDISRRVERLNELLNSSMQAFRPQIPDSLTREKVLEIVSDIMECMTQSLSETIAELKAGGIHDFNSSPEAWQPLYVGKVNAKLQEKHSEHNITQEVLNEAISKYGNDDSIFAGKLQQLNDEHEKKLAELGLAIPRAE